ncbi:hypothetical protein [Saccharopolyspora kobensis]|uniref:hypothetical protein n=1 Tax=Saccharopolyspora kobensis TaxID=146035 RepID=UPI000CDEB823|nr:hypothetical protein [Saccharopolyspora kobensis]
MHSFRSEPRRTAFQIALWGVAVLSLGAYFASTWFQDSALGILFNTTFWLSLFATKTLRHRQLTDVERESEPGQVEASAGSEEQQPVPRRNALSRGVKVVLLLELVLALAGGALHLLQIDGSIGLRSVTATTLLLAGSISIACGILLHGLLRRLGSPEKWADTATAVGITATFPLLCWLGYYAGRRNGHCIYRHSDGSKQDFTCAPQESGRYMLLVNDIGSYLGRPVVGAAFMVALFIGAALAIGLPDRGNRAVTKSNLICALLASALLATVFALQLADAPEYDLGWSALAVLVVILPPVVHAVRRRVQLERMGRPGSPLSRVRPRGRRR